MNARIFGSGERIAAYEVDDTELAVGSTLGGPKGAIIVKASGAIEKLYSGDLGLTLLAGVSIHFWDGPSGAARTKVDGRFKFHPDLQEYRYRIDDGVLVCEQVFVLSGMPRGDVVDPLTAYLATTPGGLDSVTAIALGSGANVPLVLAVQALRVFVVILSGPPLAKLIARIA